MADLTGSSQPVTLGGNFRIRAPGIFGRANIVMARTMSGTSRSTTAAQERPALDRALESHGMRDIATIDVTVTRKVDAAPGAVLRGPTGDDALELEVPAPPVDHDAIVLAVDEAGAITWNLPLAPDGAPAPAVTRGPGQAVRFRIPNTPAISTAAGAQTTRSIFGTIGKKILKVLVYPITDLVVGPIVEAFAEKWEKKNRPYRLRLMTPDNFTLPDVKSLAPDDLEWEDLAKGRSLLFVHGTFSTAHSAFAGLTAEDVAALSAAYGGRLYALDHFTLSHSPTRNVEEFVGRLPVGLAFNSDIVCHSRGGLVSREIVEKRTTNGLDGRLKVGKVVFVGAANAGTILTQPDHMVHMIDRFTTAIDVLPDGPVTWILEAIIAAIKVIGHGGLKSLDGLASMNPEGAYHKRLSTASSSSATYLGITADFDPQGSPFSRLALKQAASNKMMDRIFEDAANDLVVPTDGVSLGSGPCFPIDASSMLSLAAEAGVTHTTYFGNPRVRAQLKTWLNG
jgi:hypothetical protein